MSQLSMSYHEYYVCLQLQLIPNSPNKRISAIKYDVVFRKLYTHSSKDQFTRKPFLITICGKSFVQTRYTIDDLILGYSVVLFLSKINHIDDSSLSWSPKTQVVLLVQTRNNKSFIYVLVKYIWQFVCLIINLEVFRVSTHLS